MITSLLNILDEFKTEIGFPTLTIASVGNIPVFYARKSADNRSEKQTEVYPQIVISDLPFKFKEDYGNSHEKIVDGFHDYDSQTGLYDKAYVFDDARQLTCPFDVTIYVKNPKHKFIVQEYFMGKYKESGGFIFNSVDTEDGKLGDVVGYTVTYTEVERKDGVFELNYSFVLLPFVALSDAAEVDLITSWTLTTNITG